MFGPIRDLLLARKVLKALKRVAKEGKMPGGRKVWVGILGSIITASVTAILTQAFGFSQENAAKVAAALAAIVLGTIGGIAAEDSFKHTANAKIEVAKANAGK